MRLNSIAAALAAASLMAAAAPAGAATPIPAGEKLAPDPAVRSGTLPNGLKYFVMQNATPAGATSIRLAMDVGSYLEEDSERGFAHFVEHMAFRSTRGAPGGLLDNPFASLGVAFGRDQNAATSLLATTYRADLPAGAADGARTLLEWMRDAADGIVFTPQAVELERGVVLAEKKARSLSADEVQRDIVRFQAGGIRSGERDPIGTEQTLGAATPEALRAFYERWYRPENARLIIVGAAPAADMEQLIRDTFGSWAAKGSAGVRPEPAKALPAREVEALSRSHANLPEVLSACRISSPDANRARSLEGLRRQTLSDVWTAIFNKRISRISLASGSAVLGGTALVGRDAPDFLGSCMVVIPVAGRWKDALAATQAELRRFVEEGPTEAETEDALDTLRRQTAGEILQARTRTNASLADQIAAAALAGRSFATPEEALRVFDVVSDGVTAADVKSAVAAEWSGRGPLLIAVAPKAPAEEELIAAWRATEGAAPLARYADGEGSEWLYSDFGKKGKVKKKERIADPGFSRFTFKNGVVLNFRRTDFEAGSAEIRVRFGRGERGFAKKDRAVAALGAGLFPLGGLGEMTYEQIAAVFTGFPAGFSLFVGDDAFFLSSSTWGDNVPDQAELLAAHLKDPAFGPLIDEKLPTVLDMTYRMRDSDPNSMADDAYERALFPDQLSMPAQAEAATLRASAFEKLLKPAITTSPLEVTIVGDLEEKAAVRAVARTFGALPPRSPLPPQPTETPFRRFPDTLPGPASATHSGSADKAAGLLVWPTFVASPQRRREEYALSLASSIFETRLLERVRGRMGKVYAPRVAQRMIDHADQGMISAAIETAAADLDPVLAAAREIAREMASGAITQEEVDKARAPAIAAREESQRSNASWAAAIAQWSRAPTVFDELLRYEPAMRAVTLEDVRSAAATWLAKEPMIATARPKAAGSAAGGR